MPAGADAENGLFGDDGNFGGNGDFADYSDFAGRAKRDLARLQRDMRAVRLGDGSTVRCARIGSGRPVVCLPVIAETNHIYLPQIQALSNEHEFIVFEPRLGATGRTGVAERVEEVRALLDALDIPAAHFLAWSHSGAVAHAFAKDWPGRCRSICVIGLPDRYGFSPPVSWLVRFAYRYSPERLLTPALLRRLLGRFLGGGRVQPEWLRRVVREIPQFTRRFIRGVLPVIVEHRPAANEIHAPALAFCGDHDPLVTVDQARRMAELIGPDCAFVVVPDGDHFLPYVMPDHVTRALGAFYLALEMADRERRSRAVDP